MLRLSKYRTMYLNLFIHFLNSNFWPNLVNTIMTKRTLSDEHKRKISEGQRYRWLVRKATYRTKAGHILGSFNNVISNPISKPDSNGT